MDKSFSLASVILSYFLVGGGMFTATLVGNELRLSGELAAYALLAAGAFVGGFIAARASRGQTILEPAIGKLIWTSAQDQTMKFVGAVGATGIAGALIGAFLSEKLFGEATRSSIPWLIYSALAAFGASLLATLFTSIVFIGGNTAAAGSDVKLSTVVLVGIGGGCLLAGLAVGASARVRPLIAALVGGGLGVAGYFAMIARTAPSDQSDAAGIAVLAGAGALVTLIGTAIGWVAVGRRHPE